MLQNAENHICIEWQILKNICDKPLQMCKERKKERKKEKQKYQLHLSAVYIPRIYDLRNSNLFL